MKRIFAWLLATVMVISMLPISAIGNATTTGEPETERVEMLTNGDFETLNSAGTLPDKWTQSGTAGTITPMEENGNRYIHMTGTGSEAVTLIQTFTISELHDSYKVSVDLKLTSGLARIKFDLYDANKATISATITDLNGNSIKNNNLSVTPAGTDWENWSTDIKFPEGTASVVAYIRVIGSGNGSEACYDNFSISYEKPVESAEPETETKKVNLITNGDFAQGTVGELPTGWTDYRSSALTGTGAAVAADPADPSNQCVQVSADGINGQYTYITQTAAIPDGVQTLDASLRLNLTKGRMRILVQFLNASNGPIGDAITYKTEEKLGHVETSGWEAWTESITVPEGAKKVWVQLKAVSFDTVANNEGIDLCYDDFALVYDTGLPAEMVTVEMLKNGTFETMNEADTLPDKWALMNSSQSVEVVQEADNKYVYLTSGTTVNSHASLTQQFTVDTLQESYKVSIKTKYLTGSLNIVFALYDADNKAIDTKAAPITYKDTGAAISGSGATIVLAGQITAGEWGTWSKDIVFPAGTAKVVVQLRSICAVADTAAEAYVDNISISYETEAGSDTTSAADAFREMLAAEKEASMMVTGSTGGAGAMDPLPISVVNPEFTNDLEGWSAFNANAQSYASHDAAVGCTSPGSLKLKFQQDVGNTTHNPIWQQTFDIVPGAEYEVSVWYKVDGEAPGTTIYPVIKLESYDITNGVVSGYADKTFKDETATGWAQRDGQWHQITGKLRTTSQASQLFLMIRMMTTLNEDCTIYFDDVELRMTAGPKGIDFDTNQIFYYEDATEAIFTTTANVEYYPDYSNITADFQVYNGQTLVWEKKGVAAANGVATAAMSFEGLGLQKEIPYCVVTTVYDEGVQIDKQSRNIYLYDRPTYINEDGKFLKNGTEEFNPVFGYHVSINKDPQAYVKAAAAGINVVQMGTFTSAADALYYLNKAQEAGIMGFIALYNGMLPAGNDANIENTLAIISDERVRNHPALFGYGVMDEVFLHFADPYADMEASYRLIRSVDKEHPIISVEAKNIYFNDSGKFVDCLIIDPYDTAESQSAYNRTQEAIEAVYSKKSVYVLLEAYRTAAGRLASAETIRNNLYQALLAGGSGVGYYSITDCERDENGAYTIPIWNANDDGALWGAINAWGQNEKAIAFAHFVNGEGTFLSKDLDADDPYWHYAWQVGGDVYLLVLGMETDQHVTATIALPSVGAFHATVIGGDEEPTTGNGSLSLTVDGVEAILYKITAATAPSISGSAVTSGGATVTAPEGGWVEGENTFTVTSDKVCIVAVKNSDGTYSRLEAVLQSDGSYQFTAELAADSEIAVVVAGDANGDGKLNIADAVRMRAALLGNVELGDLEALASDAGGNGLNIADVVKLRAVLLGTTEFVWAEP